MVGLFKRHAAASVLILLIGGGFSNLALAGETDSGFLSDYSQLEVKKDALGVERRVWISPRLTRKAYHKALLEPVGYFPEPEPSEKVSMGTLDSIRHYIDGSVRKALAGVVPLADNPGPGVLRVRTAITAAEIEDMKLKPYQLLPVALVFTAAKEASGSAHRAVRLFVETEITDSVSGEPLARSVREAQGLEVESGEALSLQIVKPRIDKWVEAMGEQLTERLGQEGL